MTIKLKIDRSWSSPWRLSAAVSTAVLVASCGGAPEDPLVEQLQADVAEFEAETGNLRVREAFISTWKNGDADASATCMHLQYELADQERAGVAIRPHGGGAAELRLGEETYRESPEWRRHCANPVNDPQGGPYRYSGTTDA